jgi:transcriptional regulator with XRE-family HTH domain
MESRNNKHVHPVDIHVGRRIEKRREEIGMQLEEFAACTNIAIGNADRIERGIRTASAPELFNIAHALHVTINFFFEKYEDNMNKETERLIKAYLSLPSPTERHKYLNFLESKAQGTDYDPPC